MLSDEEKKEILERHSDNTPPPDIKYDEIYAPYHYNWSLIEPIEIIESWDLDYCLGNVIKYIGRHNYKDNPIKDLKKAAWYLNHRIETLEKRQEELGTPS